MTLTRKLQRMKECQLNQHLFVRFMSGRSLTSTWKSNPSTPATLNQEKLFSQNSYSHLYLSPFRRLHLFSWNNRFIFSYIPSSWQIIFARALLIRPYPGSVCFVWHFWDSVILNLSTAWCLLETSLERKIWHAVKANRRVTQLCCLLACLCHILDCLSVGVKKFTDSNRFDWCCHKNRDTVTETDSVPLFCSQR